MTWLASQVDYLLFITGLCYMTASMAAIVARLENDRSLPWTLLGASLGGLGLVVWAQLIGYDIADPAWFIVGRSLVRFVCWAALLEFGRRSIRIRGQRPSIWLTLGPVIVALLSGLLGPGPFNIVMHVTVALPAGAAALVAMWHVGRESDRWIVLALRWAGIGIAVNAGFAAAVYALNPAGSGRVTFGGVPAPVFVAATSLIVVTSLMLFSVFHSARHSRSRGVAAIASGLSIVPLIFAIAAVGWISTNELADVEAENHTASLVQRARTMASSLGNDALSRVGGPLSADDLARVRSLQTQLDRIRFANPDVTRISLLARDTAGRVRFIAASGQGSVTFGQPYESTSRGVDRAIESMGTAVDGPDPRDGTVMAVVPARTGSTGAMIGMLATSYTGTSIAETVAITRLTGIGITAVVAFLGLFFFALFQMSSYASTAFATSEQKLRRVLDRAPEGILLLEGADWKVVEANPRALDMLATTAEDLRGTSFDGLLEPVRSVEGKSATSCSIATGTSDWLVRAADDREVAIELTTTPLELATGDITLAFLHDVTARRRAEAELHERVTLENLVRAVSSRFIAAEPGDIDRFIDDALATFGTFFSVGRAYLFRFTEDDARMENTHEWCATGVDPLIDRQQELPTASYPWLMKRLRNNEFVHVPKLAALPPEAGAERGLLEARGSHSTLIVPMTSGWRASGFLGFDAIDAEREWTSERIALISVLADIFASAMRRARSEEELAKLSLAVTQSPAATVITDADGTIEYVNPRFRELSGYGNDELVGRNPRILKSGVVEDDVYARLWDTITSGRQWRGEFANKRKDGSLYWVQVSISPVRDARGRIHYVSVQEDISAMKEAEDALAAAAEAANAANRAKSDFLATMSHEIRTPMNAIIGMAELLDETMLSEEQQRYVRVFRSAGESLLTLINDVLDLSKIEAGRLDLDVREFDVERLVEETAEVLAVRAREKGIELLCRVDGSVPGRMIGDPDRLRQVLINLIGNAVKFTAQGHVLVSVERTAGEGDDDIRLAFSVTDTGIGIPESKLGGIFEAFTQADSSTTREYGGTGLGLTIAERLVELMGGRIGVTSTEGSGSTFTFEARFGPAESSIRADGVSGLEGVRALVVDDNAANRLIERQYLEGAGALVDEAEDGPNAIERLRSGGEPYDIVLLDLRMPQMSGIEVAERIHNQDDLHGPAVLIVSSDSRPGDGQRARDAGAQGLLMKPIRRRDLVSAVRAAIDGAHGRKPRHASPKRTEPITGQAKLRVLLVEDTEDNRLLVQAYLRATPHELTMVEDGQKAVDAYNAAGPGGFDVILMDMQMPVKDGYTATREIREIESTDGGAKAVIVALTAYALPQEAKQAIDAGCDEYLTKPIKKATLLEALARHAGAMS